MDILITVGKNIQEAREAKSWARFELAEMIGVSEELIEQYELGQKDMMIDRLEQIANLLGIEASALLIENR